MMPTLGSSTARGYGAAHRRARAAWKPKVERGNVRCSLCKQAIAAGEPWDLDHEPGTTRYRGPAHVSCNRADGGRRKHAKIQRRWRL